MNDRRNIHSLRIPRMASGNAIRSYLSDHRFFSFSPYGEESGRAEFLPIIRGRSEAR